MACKSLADDPYERLGNAIILQAANDYRKALKKFKKNPHNHEAEREVVLLEMFFRSEWYLVLTKIDPEYLIDNLRKEV